MIPCPSCGCHVRTTELGCIHCGGAVGRSAPTGVALLLAFTLAACTGEPHVGQNIYGAMHTDVATGDTSDTGGAMR